MEITLKDYFGQAVALSKLEILTNFNQQLFEEAVKNNN
jgi:hypothetical protein